MASARASSRSDSRRGPGELAVILQPQAALCQLSLHRLDLLLDGLVQLRLGGRIVERGGGLPHQLVLKLHLGALVIVAAEIFAHLCAQVVIAAAADGLGELVLRTVFTTLADLMHLADKLGVLAGQFRGVVLCGERSHGRAPRRRGGCPRADLQSRG